MQSKTAYLSVDSPETVSEDRPGGFWSDCWKLVVMVLKPLASLRITVVLFLMAIFIVFAGTLAQTEKGLWQVVHDYFRMDLSSPQAAASTAFAWIDYRIFFPRVWFPHMEPIEWGWGFPFPNGWLIGFGLFINLTAAHLIRFRVQSKGPRLWAGLLTVATGIVITLMVIMAGSFQSADRPEIFLKYPSLRILWLLFLCALASSVLLAGSILVFRRRAGVVLLHAGIGLLMVGELLVGVAAVETNMQLQEGQTVNYLIDNRHQELVLIDRSDPEEDEVFAIPGSRLREGEIIDDAELPVKVEVLRYMVNSQLRPAKPGEKNLATAGTGLTQIAQEIKPVSGVDNSGRRNLSTVYVKFIDKESGKSLGVYRVGLRDWLTGRSEMLKVGDRHFQVQLRYRHYYQPYSMHLVDVEQKVYMGTQTARSYSSELRLVDRDKKVDRMVRIWMNNPLRYGGATFYQSNYDMDPMTGKETTGLQVVTNTGWRIPYVACVMVVFGMLAQFYITLSRYLKRRAEGRLETGTPGTTRNATGDVQAGPVSPAIQSSSVWRWVVPLAVVLLSAGWLVNKSLPVKAKRGTIDYAAFGRLPLTYEGRIKPFDTLARGSLRKISDRSYYRDENGDRQPAVRWLLDLITNSRASRDHKVFRVHNLDVLETLGLKPREGFRYAYNELSENYDEFRAQVEKARAADPDDRDLYALKILDLEKRLNEFFMLHESFRQPQLELATSSADLRREMMRRNEYAQYSLPLAVPPADGEGEWKAFTFAAFDARAKELVGSQGNQLGKPNPFTIALRNVLNAYDADGGNAGEFNGLVKDYEELLLENPPQNWQPGKTDFEADFNHAAPLYHAMVLYALALVLGFFSWIAWTGPLRSATNWLCIFTLIIHTLGLVARIYISGRPPVTSLYTSTLFVGWACVVFGLLIERFTKLGIANVVAAATGFLALLIGYALTTKVEGFKGDSFTVLVAVLDTNFWLATHVVCVSAGYSATFFAGFLGLAYVLRGVFSPSLSPELGKNIARMIYGVTCFAILFSFFGTVLGGLWADDSWGRFWGWDPKENGALIIVLWNAVVLHALWGRMIGERMLAALAVFGNIVTAWSWFGVNELRVGLHTYGFTEGVLLLLGIWVGFNLLIFVIACLPKSIWISTIAQRPVTAEVVKE